MVVSDLGVRMHRGAFALRYWSVSLALFCISQAAFAQVIPGSVLPGREREQLLDRRTAPRVQPGGPAISLPSTQAPAGAAQTTLVIRRIQIVGSTIYSDKELATLYGDL